MAFIRKKIGKGVTQTTNLNTGTTRYTHSIKTGSTTTSQSWNSKGNSRRTRTTNIGGVISRTQSSTSPKKYTFKSSSKRSRGRKGKIFKVGWKFWGYFFLIYLLIYLFK